NRLFRAPGSGARFTATKILHLQLLPTPVIRFTGANSQKRAAAKQFLTDVKGFRGIDARALNPKSELDQSWKLEASELFAYLRKNAKTLAAQNVRLTESDEEKIRARFSKAKEELVPLEAQIAFTDDLIDEIVYRLYGLTQEEIELVNRTRANEAEG